MFEEKKPAKQYDEKKLAYIELVEKDYPLDRDCSFTPENYYSCEEIRLSVARLADARAALPTDLEKCKEKAENWGEVFHASVLQECIEKQEVKFGKVLNSVYENLNDYKAFEQLSYWDKRKLEAKFESYKFEDKFE